MLTVILARDDIENDRSKPQLCIQKEEKQKQLFYQSRNLSTIKFRDLNRSNMDPEINQIIDRTQTPIS